MSVKIYLKNIINTYIFNLANSFTKCKLVLKDTLKEIVLLVNDLSTRKQLLFLELRSNSSLKAHTMKPQFLETSTNYPLLNSNSSNHLNSKEMEMEEVVIKVLGKKKTRKYTLLFYKIKS